MFSDKGPGSPFSLVCLDQVYFPEDTEASITALLSFPGTPALHCTDFIGWELGLSSRPRLDDVTQMKSTALASSI